jgi:pimeloyl-ACP methyl ester carboxylesterase
VAFDWRGQGLADRPQHRRDMGHVTSFDEYREDVAAFRHALETLGLPGPYHLIAHSMGGAIGLRALHDGLPVKAAAFSAPMWGIQMTPFMKSIAGIVLGLAGPFGFGTTFAPTTGPWQPMEFDDNPLTTDRDQFDYMSRQVAAHPELALGGPSVLWVKAALEETAAFMKLPAPDIPTVTLVGTRESIVEVPAIESRMASWPKGSPDHRRRRTSRNADGGARPPQRGAERHHRAFRGRRGLRNAPGPSSWQKTPGERRMARGQRPHRFFVRTIQPGSDQQTLLQPQHPVHPRRKRGVVRGDQRRHPRLPHQPHHSMSNTRSDVSGSRLPVGSSASSSRGALASARQKATRCCSPPDSSAGR